MMATSGPRKGIRDLWTGADVVEVVTVDRAVESALYRSHTATEKSARNWIAMIVLLTRRPCTPANMLVELGGRAWC